MAAQKGSAIIIRVGDTGSPSAFTDVAGLRTKNITLNREIVDVTNSDSAGKARELLAEAGIQSMDVSGDGVFLDHASQTTLESMHRAGTIRDFQIFIPAHGTYEGLFQIESLEFAGDHNAEITMSMTLQSAGVTNFTTA